MKKLVKILLIVGVFLVFFIGCIIKLHNNYSNNIRDSVNLIVVPVAKVDILANTLITSDMIEYEEINENQLNKGDITNVNLILGKVTTVKILKGSNFNSSYFKE